MADDKQRTARRKEMEDRRSRGLAALAALDAHGGTAPWTRRATVNAARICSISSSGSTASSTAKATFLAAVRDWLRDD